LSGREVNESFQHDLAQEIGVVGERGDDLLAAQRAEVGVGPLADQHVVARRRGLTDVGDGRQLPGGAVA
jgi:hypothetical protein